MLSLIIGTAKLVLRVLAVLLIGFVSAVIGLIVGAIVGGTLAGIVEIIFGYEFVFNGRTGYEATGQIGFLLGAVIGFIVSSVYLFGRRTKMLDL